MIDTNELEGLTVEELRAGIILQRREIDRLRERVQELIGIIDDIRHWDISNLSLDIPLPLRKRMQNALAAKQEGKS